MRCRNENCRRIHNALPNFLVPHKHYSSEVIEDVLDDVVRPNDELNDSDYPCEKTMERWKAWFERNRKNIDGQLKSVGYRILGFSEKLLISGVSLSDELRKTEQDGWEPSCASFTIPGLSKNLTVPTCFGLMSGTESRMIVP